jgi:glycosyltransferase involved in cell wall biosynthesis
MTTATRQAPFFSVIVPTYNRAEKVVLAVNSILGQTFRDYEVIMVDDGSTDNTQGLMAELVKENPAIRYFYKKNEERSIARNFGIQHAFGKYVTFLDSDDVIYNNHLSTAYELLKRNAFPEIGHLGYELIDESGNVILKRNNFDASFKEQLIHENIAHANAIFIRRDIATAINFIPSPAAIVSEDWYVWLRLAARYPFYFDNTITSAVVHHRNRSLLNIDPDKLIASTDTIVDYLKRDEAFLKAYKSKVAYHLSNHYTFLTLILALSKNRRLSTLKYLAKAIRYDAQVVFRRRFLATIKHWLW